MFVHLSVKVVQTLFHLLPRILFDNFAQLLFVERQLVAHLLLTYSLSHTCLNSFKEMLQERRQLTHHNNYEDIHFATEMKYCSSHIKFLQWLTKGVNYIRLQVVCVFVLGLPSLCVQAGNL